MELLIKIVGLCLLGTLVATLLRRESAEMSAIFIVAVALCAATLLTSVSREALVLARELIELTGLSQEVFAPLFKVAAIAVTVRISSSFCRDASQSALAALLEVAGAICALLAAAPLLRAVIGMVGGWL